MLVSRFDFSSVSSRRGPFWFINGLKYSMCVCGMILVYTLTKCAFKCFFLSGIRCFHQKEKGSEINEWADMLLWSLYIPSCPFYRAHTDTICETLNHLSMHCSQYTGTSSLSPCTHTHKYTHTHTHIPTLLIWKYKQVISRQAVLLILCHPVVYKALQMMMI